MAKTIKQIAHEVSGVREEQMWSPLAKTLFNCAVETGKRVVEQLTPFLTESDDVDDICLAYHQLQDALKHLKEA